MGSKASSVVGLEVGKWAVKLVEYSLPRRQVTTIAIMYLDPSDWNDEQGLSSKILGWIGDKRQSKQAQLALAVPAGHSVIFNMEGSADSPLEEVRWELEQYLGAPASDYLFDFHTAQGAGLEAQVLVAAHRRAEVERWRRLLETAEMPLAVMDLDVLAVLNAFEANYPEFLGKSTLLIKADFEGVSCISTSKGQFVQLVCPSRGRELSRAEGQHKERLIAQVVEELAKLGAEGFDGVFFCGDRTADFEFASALDAAFPEPPVRLDSFKRVRFPHPQEYTQKVAETAPQCAAALGLALRHTGDG